MFFSLISTNIFSNFSGFLTKPYRTFTIYLIPLVFPTPPSLSWIKLFIAAWKLEKKIIFLRNSANFPSFDDCQTWGLAWHTDSWKSMHQHIMTNNSSNTNKHLMWCSMRNSRLTRFSRVNLLWTQTRRIFILHRYSLSEI